MLCRQRRRSIVRQKETDDPMHLWEIVVFYHRIVFCFFLHHIMPYNYCAIPTDLLRGHKVTNKGNLPGAAKGFSVKVICFSKYASENLLKHVQSKPSLAFHI